MGGCIGMASQTAHERLAALSRHLTAVNFEANCDVQMQPTKGEG